MNPTRPITGRMVLFGMLIFFGIVFAVNGALIYFAVDSWSGLSNARPFEDGRDHDRILARAEAQAALGWRSAVALVPSAAGQGQTVEVTLTGRNGAPLGGLEVELELRRPARADLDLSLNLSETTAGHYRGTVALPLPGRWYAEIRVPGADGPRYRMEHEIAVEP
ncbi:MAG: FixH family protein [Alphaproteobacteria bacterium]